MVDFAEGISDRTTGERLSRTLEGKGAFRRFKNELHKDAPNCYRSGLRCVMPGHGSAPCSGWRTKG